MAFTSVKTNSVCLTWEPPEGLSEPLSYLVTWRSEGDNNSNSLTMSGHQIVIQNLTPAQTYTFTVATLYGGKQSSPVSATAVTEVPTPDNVHVKVDQTSASVTWSKPKIAEDDEVSYEVILNSEDECPKVTQTTSLQCSFEELTMGREYSISVAVQKNGIESKSITKTITIAKCQPTKECHPECYLLPTKKTNIGEFENVRRWTFGKSDSSKTVKNILVVGETGTGKTTLINTIANYLLGVQWDDKVWFQITEENKNKSQEESQTTAITVYELFVETSSLSLRIIDTPGYGCTEDMELDQMVGEHLQVLFQSEDGIHEISAVGLVVRAGQNRLTEFQRYIFDAILSLFGKDMEKNIVVMITHSDGILDRNVINVIRKADIPCAKEANGDPVNFLFNNRQSEDHSGREDVYQKAWGLSYISMVNFERFLVNADIKELKMTEGVLRERKRLEACVNNIQDAIEMEELKQKELKQIQSALKDKKEKFEVDEPYKGLEPINLPWWCFTTKATCCPKCKENCHYPGCRWVTDLSRCSAMKNGRCTVCTGKCPAHKHVRDDMIYVAKTRKVTRTAQAVRDKYKEQANIMNALEEDLRKSKIKQNELLLEAYQSICKLEEIALKKDSMSTLIHLDLLIEKMKELKDDEKTQKLIHLMEKYDVSNKRKIIRWMQQIKEQTTTQC
ncbi:uncharacterized protein LOC134451781 [Engraulis encrasicolus]|uniref:uncharacterized protein LOC134451781 n=1 Tax=Engraulis encrasicolus TaxID=184585 RepID=UPI002FD6895D